MEEKQQLVKVKHILTALCADVCLIHNIADYIFICQQKVAKAAELKVVEWN